MPGSSSSGGLGRRPFLGVSVEGNLVRALWPGVEAAAAGLAIGDTIAAIDGRPVRGSLTSALAGKSAGDSVSVAVHRGPTQHTVSVTLLPWPCESTAEATTHYGVVQSQGVRLRTIATIPDGPRPGGYPMVLVLPGMTGPPVDHGPAVDDPLRRLVVVLAAASIATLRVERLGVGDSEGDPETGDFDAEVDAYARALLAHADRPDIDARHTYAFGHSLGGIQAPLVADLVPLAGIAAYGTTAGTWTEAWMASVERQVEILGLSGMAAAQARRRGEPETEDTNRVFGRPRRYIDGLRRANAARSWARFGGHALLMHGEHDVVTTLDEHRAIRTMCPQAELQQLPGLDHAMLAAADPETSLRTPERGRIVDDVAAAVAHFVVASMA